MGMIKLKMPKTESDRNDGINDGNIETYKNTPILSLTKEELQNSTDGAQRDENGNPCKVNVEFNDFYLKKEDFPDFNETKNIFLREKNYWIDFYQNDKRAINFFDNALNILNSDNIRCLRISDFNTTGLTGIDGKSTPWQNLVKNRGVSDKPRNYGGSFGIGKDAAFACSQLRIVFYGTYNIENEKAFQGVIKLPSYQYDDINFDGNGFYSLNDETNKNYPIRELLSLDYNYIRTNYGMDKYIIGFDNEFTQADLKKEIIVSSIDNFLYAFFADMLEVKYSDIIVSKATLSTVFEQYNNAINPLTKEYYETLINSQRVEYVTILEENDVKIFIRLDPEGSRKAAIVRQSGMKVFDKTHISGRIGFSAVIVLTGNEVNGFFKELENSEHTQWSIDRAENKIKAKEYQNKIFDRLREILKEMHQEDYESSIDADGLNEYLPYAYVSGKKNKIDSLSNEIEEKRKAIKKKNNQKKEKYNYETINYEIDENGNIQEDTIRIDKHNNPTPNPDPNPNPKPEKDVDVNGDGENTYSISDEDKKFKSKKKISNDIIHYHLIRKDDLFKLKLISTEDLKSIFIEIMISGEQDNLNVFIQSAEMNTNPLLIRDNKIYVSDINKGEMKEIIFKLKQKGNWALEVITNESEK